MLYLRHIFSVSYCFWLSHLHERDWTWCGREDIKRCTYNCGNNFHKDSDILYITVLLTTFYVLQSMFCEEWCIISTTCFLSNWLSNFLCDDVNPCTHFKLVFVLLAMSHSVTDCVPLSLQVKYLSVQLHFKTVMCLYLPFCFQTLIW